jgi:hypothetical protein
MGVSGLKAFKSKPIMGRVNEIVTLVVVSMVWMKVPNASVQHPANHTTI